MRTFLCQIIDQQLNSLKAPFQSLQEKQREKVIKKVLAKARTSNLEPQSANQPVSVPSKNVSALPIRKTKNGLAATQSTMIQEQHSNSKQYECCDDCINQHNLQVLNKQQAQLRQTLRKKNEDKLRQHIGKKEFSNSLKTGKIIKNHQHIQHMNYSVYPSWWPSGFYCSSDLRGLTPKVTQVKPSSLSYHTQDDFYFKPKHKQALLQGYTPPAPPDIRYQCLQRDPLESQQVKPAGVSSSRPFVSRKRMRSCSPNRNFRATKPPMQFEDRHCGRNHHNFVNPSQEQLRRPHKKQVHQQIQRIQPAYPQTNYPYNREEYYDQNNYEDPQPKEGSIAKAAMAAAKRKKCKELEKQVQRKKRQIDQLREQVARKQQQRNARRKEAQRQQLQEQLIRRSQARQQMLRRKKGQLNERIAKQYQQSSIRRKEGQGGIVSRGDNRGWMVDTSQQSEMQQRRNRFTMERSQNESLGGSVRKQMFSRLVNRIEENNSSDSQFSDYQD